MAEIGLPHISKSVEATAIKNSNLKKKKKKIIQKGVDNLGKQFHGSTASNVHDFNSH